MHSQIRTVTIVKPEWLLEYASNYYDVQSPHFPDGDAKRALLRLMGKKEAKGCVRKSWSPDGTSSVRTGGRMEPTASRRRSGRRTSRLRCSGDSVVLVRACRCRAHVIVPPCMASLPSAPRSSRRSVYARRPLPVVERVLLCSALTAGTTSLRLQSALNRSVERAHRPPSWLASRRPASTRTSSLRLPRCVPRLDEDAV
jgi:hypothetical protein